MGSTSAVTCRRRLRRAVLVVTIAAVVAPAVHGHDDFPLSTYPMYASDRGGIAAVDTVRGVTRTGNRVALSMAAIADTDDPLIAESAVGQAVRDGRADQWCRAVANRYQGEADGGIADVEIVAIEVVTEVHDLIASVERQPSLVERTVHARCSAEVGP